MQFWQNLLLISHYHKRTTSLSVHVVQKITLGVKKIIDPWFEFSYYIEALSGSAEKLDHAHTTINHHLYKTS